MCTLQSPDVSSGDADMVSTQHLTTGALARLLNTTEPRVAETVRRGRINPEPVIVAGRRLWSPDQVRQAADALGLPQPDLHSVAQAAEVR